MSLLSVLFTSLLHFLDATYKWYQTISVFLCRNYFTEHAAAAAAKSLQLCPTLCDPTDGSPPGSPVPGILQARTLEWVAISFSNAWKWKVKVKSLSRVQPSATPWTAAYQAPPAIEFSRQEYWSGVPLPSPNTGDIGCESSIPRLMAWTTVRIIVLFTEMVRSRWNLGSFVCFLFWYCCKWGARVKDTFSYIKFEILSRSQGDKCKVF